MAETTNRATDVSLDETSAGFELLFAIRAHREELLVNIGTRLPERRCYRGREVVSRVPDMFASARGKSYSVMSL